MKRVPGWPTLFAAALAALLCQGATADLVGHMQVRAAVAGKSDETLIATNPVLEILGREHAEELDEILARLRAPVEEQSHQRTFAQSAAPETDADSAIFEQNPDLAALYRESPEAALDLLRLIREATQSH